MPQPGGALVETRASTSSIDLLKERLESRQKGRTPGESQLRPQAQDSLVLESLNSQHAGAADFTFLQSLQGLVGLREVEELDFDLEGNIGGEREKFPCVLSR